MSLDSLVRSHGESCDLVLLCSERRDRALPANLRVSVSKETIGGEIVDRDGDHEPARMVFLTLRRGRTEVRPYVVQDVVCQERILDVAACAEQRAARGESL